MAILDDEASGHRGEVDLNPVAAGIAEVPEIGERTSIKVRSEHVDGQGRTVHSKRPLMERGGFVQVSRSGRVAVAVPDRGSAPVGFLSRGELEAISRGGDSLLVDYTARLYRKGKVAISAELAGNLDRLGSNAESWLVPHQKLRSGRSFCRSFAASLRTVGLSRRTARRANVWRTWLGLSERDDANLNFGLHRQQ